MTKIVVNSKEYEVKKWKYISFLKYLELQDKASRDYVGEPNRRRLSNEEVSCILNNRVGLSQDEINDLSVDDGIAFLSEIAKVDNSVDEGKKN